MSRADELRRLNQEFAERVLGYNNAIHYYAESLDAAWAGVEKLNACSVELYKTQGKWGCIFIQPGRGHVSSEGLFATPAEALVRACLEAVKK